MVTSIACLAACIALVPLPQDLFEANYSPDQLGAFDHFNMIIAAFALQLLWPFATLLIVGYHTECQKDLTVLICLAWLGELDLAMKYLLSFLGFDHGLGVGMALSGLLAAGCWLEQVLINALADVKSVLHIDFGLPYMQKLLRMEMIGIAIIVLLATLNGLLEASFLRILLSLLCWAYLSGGLYLSCLLVRRVGSLSALSPSEVKDDNPALRAVTMVSAFRRALAFTCGHRLLIITYVLLFGGFLWPAPDNLSELVYESWGHTSLALLVSDTALAATLWFLMLVFGAVFIIRPTSIFVTHQRHLQETARLEKRKLRQVSYRPAQDEGWQEKVEDLAKRAISLDALLRFYQGLGKDYMYHFEPERHTTDDVVRQAIIPLSAEKQSDMSQILMPQRVRPSAMVTHTWHARFRDLVAAVVAEALQEQSYLRIGVLLDNDMNLVRKWLRKTGELKTTYWICAFCVNQHSSICTPSFPIFDSITSVPVAACACGCQKYLNTDLPCRRDRDEPMSIHCEMNKFSDMISWLAATDSNFRQLLAVDSNLEVFSRAWCMAEIAEAYMMGMKQLLAVSETSSLTDRHEKLQALRIENMKASRPEDVQEILRRIPDKAEFNEQLQRLFGRLFSSFWGLPPSHRLKMTCREVRWQLALGEEGWDMEKLAEIEKELHSMPAI